MHYRNNEVFRISWTVGTDEVFFLG